MPLSYSLSLHRNMHKCINLFTFSTLSLSRSFSRSYFFRFCFDVSLLALLRLCSLYETCIIKNNTNGNFVLFFTNKNGFGRPRKRAVVAPKWSKVCASCKYPTGFRHYTRAGSGVCVCERTRARLPLWRWFRTVRTQVLTHFIFFYFFEDIWRLLVAMNSWWWLKCCTCAIHDVALSDWLRMFAICHRSLRHSIEIMRFILLLLLLSVGIFWFSDTNTRTHVANRRKSWIEPPNVDLMQTYFTLSIHTHTHTEVTRSGLCSRTPNAIEGMSNDDV